MINCLLVKQCTWTKIKQRWISKILHISNLQCGPNKKRKRGKLGKLGNLGKLPQTQNMWPGTHGRQPFPDSNYIVSFNTSRTAIRHSHIVTRRTNLYEICNWVKRVMYFDNTHCWRTLLSSRCYCSDEIDEIIDSPTHTHSLTFTLTSTNSGSFPVAKCEFCWLFWISCHRIVDCWCSSHRKLTNSYEIERPQMGQILRNLEGSELS